MIISIHKGKAFDEIQDPFMIKMVNKPGTEGNIINLIKGNYEKPTAHTVFSGERLNAFSLRLGRGKKTGTIACTTSIQCCIGGSSQCNHERQRNENMEKSEIKTYVHTILIAPKWKQSRCLSTGTWINKM